MSTVTLQIGGRSYQVACADGEEAHIEMLGGMIDAKFTAMGSAKTPQEAQNFLFASLMLADEVHEASGKSGAPAAPVPSSGDTANAQNAAELEELRSAQSSLNDELESLSKELQSARDEAKSLSEQLKEAKEAAEQRDMFGEDVIAGRLEELAAKAESFAEALEGSAA